jgi:hypothetical protein
MNQKKNDVESVSRIRFLLTMPTAIEMAGSIKNYYHYWWMREQHNKH